MVGEQGHSYSTKPSIPGVFNPFFQAVTFSLVDAGFSRS